MKMFARYSETYEIKMGVNPDLYIDSFKKKVQEQLRIIEARTEVRKDTMLFKRIVRNTTHSGMNKVEAMKILREGSIQIEKHGTNRIKIIWEIKTDSLIFMSVVSGLVGGLVFGFAGSTMILSIVFGLVSSVILFFVGYAWIGAEIDRIMESSI